MIIDPLKIFVTVVEQRHFSRAAKLLNLSQPNVSLHIRNLENELDTTLFIRSPKQVKITESGEMLYLRAKKILSLYEEAKQEIASQKQIIQGTITIGASFTIGEYILPRLLAEYANENPLVHVEVTVGNTEEVIEKTKSNELDIGLIEGERHDLNIKAIPFMEDEMIIIAPSNHQLAQLRMVKPEMLHDQTWIWREKGSGTRAYSDQLIANLNLRVRRSFIFSSSQGIKEAVSAGLGIAMISKLTVKKELQSGEIKQIDISDRTFTRQFSMIQGKRDFINRAHDIFIEKIMNVKD
ncbi:LysR family transcriptional regulator [Halalkalibacter akibai]|uniref:LysR family transcriptional regulator YeiE n=1 Tax=Halalkalibacter akibai (strain ATCC 43226 / DSM 21942 / CIP 109018 / JCM 9157 / 1139) TaxID=1236973 RepID=W4QYL7_HALA3|nr:LysR family transcriptional regulator [Halalkalibacter akibai]GAE36982.1 LysR family transcriptional regulator YeiE [Halalkalibacter akibai JCM 9157]